MFFIFLSSYLPTNDIIKNIIIISTFSSDDTTDAVHHPCRCYALFFIIVIFNKKKNDWCSWYMNDYKDIKHSNLLTSIFFFTQKLNRNGDQECLSGQVRAGFSSLPVWCLAAGALAPHNRQHCSRSITLALFQCRRYRDGARSVRVGIAGKRPEGCWPNRRRIGLWPDGGVRVLQEFADPARRFLAETRHRGAPGA